MKAAVMAVERNFEVEQEKTLDVAVVRGVDLRGFEEDPMPPARTADRARSTERPTAQFGLD